MANAKGSDPIDELVPTADDVVEDEAYLESLRPQARTAMTDDLPGVEGWPMSDQTMAQRMATGLRDLADMVERNPEVGELLRYAVTGGMGMYAETAEEIAAFSKAAVRAGAEVVKDWPTDPNRHFSVTAKFGPVEVRMHTERAVVCERVVTGTETVTKKVKDPEALAAIPEVEVTEEVETFEWVCRPLLATDAPADAEAVSQ